jgi:HlyD family secretion protein
VRQLSDSIAPDADPEPGPILISATTALIDANTGYDAALDARDEAKASVDAAGSALAAAQAALSDLTAPADPSDIATAQAAVTAAEQALRAAQLAQDELLRGPTDTDIANAQGAVDSARASLTAAVAARSDLLAGADQEDIDLQTQQVRLAELAVERAQQAVEDATLTAPFDGTAAAIPIHMGDVITPATPAITILSPNALRVKLTLGETDLPSVRVGQAGLIIFDAIQGVAYPLEITSIGLAPETQQGVVTYTALAELTRLDEGGEDVRPAPGMNGAAVVTTEEKPNVLGVPNQAIRRRGNNDVVDVLVDGKPETRVIRTGTSDATNTEVTSGLETGDLVILPGSPGSTAGEATPEGEDLPGGIR